jgi:ATP synthase protein I
MGLVGWAVAVPTLLGAALGFWLDARHPGEHPWSLALLMAGLVLGCLNAWHWVTQQDRAMREADRADDRVDESAHESADALAKDPQAED